MQNNRRENANPGICEKAAKCPPRAGVTIHFRCGTIENTGQFLYSGFDYAPAVHFKIDLRLTHKSDFSLADMGQKKQALFIILPDQKTTFYPIASLVVSQQYELLAEMADRRGGRLERRVNFVLDEFGNFTPISDMTNKLTVAAGRGNAIFALYPEFQPA